MNPSAPTSLERPGAADRTRPNVSAAMSAGSRVVRHRHPAGANTGSKPVPHQKLGGVLSAILLGLWFAIPTWAQAPNEREGTSGTQPRRAETPSSTRTSRPTNPPVTAEQARTSADPAASPKPDDAPPTAAPRELPFADFVPASANLFISIRNLRALDSAFRRARAWPLIASWSRDNEDDELRAPDIRTALTVLLGPTTSINLNEFMESEVAIVASDWADLSHLLWLVRVRDSTTIDRWFPPDRRLAKHTYADAHAFRMDNGLVVTVRGNLFAMGRRWTDDRVLVDTMRLLQGTAGESLGADPDYRSMTGGLPGNVLCTASFRLDAGDEAERDASRDHAKSPGAPSDKANAPKDKKVTSSGAVDAMTSLWPVGRRVVIGVAESRGGLEIIARGTGAFGKDAGEVGAAAVTQLLSLPSTTILAMASTISGPNGAPISSLAKGPSTWNRYARMFDALHRAGPRGATALPSIGPGWILAWDRDLEGVGAAPQAALLVQCRDAARLVDDARAVIADFARVLLPAAPGEADDSPFEIRQHAHLGVAYFSVPLAPIAEDSAHPVLRLLPDAEISWAAADDWLVVTLSREHLERILDARAGLALPLRGLKDAPRLGSHPTGYRFVALMQPALAADVVERWRVRLEDGGFVRGASAHADVDPARVKAMATTHEQSESTAKDTVPQVGIGFTLAPEHTGGVAVIESVESHVAEPRRLRPGDRILGVNGQLLTMDSPAADLRRKLMADDPAEAKTLRVQRDGAMLDIVLPPAPVAAPRIDPDEGLPALDALEDLLFTARTVSVALFAVEGGAPTRYSARTTLRFVPLPQETKRADGN